MRSGHVLIVILLVTALLSHPAASQPWGDQPPGQQVGIPIYDPGSKRYFALMHRGEGSISGLWETVAQAARSQLYKDVRGRLAIVDSLEVHEFLLRTFHPGHYQYIWIGLRYLCKAKKLEWSNGQLWQPGSFQIWDKEWSQDPYTCYTARTQGNPNDFAPVAYSPEMHSWVAKGIHKGYDWYFVEFPTGHP